MESLIYFVGLYYILSLTFFLFPIRKKTLISLHPLFKKVLLNKGTLHISHRGGSREKLENTIEAFQNAIQVGSNCLEMDVCFTKDKKVIVSHDSLMTRLCGVNQHTHDFDYDQIPIIMDSVYLDFAINKSINTNDCKTKYFPLLEDVFKQFPNSLMNIEIKTPNKEINIAVNNLIIKYKREHLTVWGARKSIDSDNLYNLNPQIARFFCADRVIKLYLQYIFGILPFCHIHEDSLQVPLYTEDFYEWKKFHLTSRIEKLKNYIFFSFIRILNCISPPLFNHLRKRGIFVAYWVLNEENEFQKALNVYSLLIFQQGARGIMTDNPTRLKEFLMKKKLFIE